MSVHRLPVLLWVDGQGVHHGCPVDGGPESVASGSTSAEVVRQTKAFVEWQIKEGWRMEDADFDDPRLETLRVPIRPQIEENDRTYPATQPVELDIPCVLGKRESGLTVCAIPLLGLEFDLHADEVLRTVVSERLRWALSGKSPQELAHLVAPPALRVETININAKEKPLRNQAENSLEALMAVATPLGTKSLRRRISRAWMRDELVQNLVNLLGVERASVLLLGPRGVGKSAILIDAVRMLESPRAPSVKPPEESETPFHKARHRYWQTSAGRLIAGMRYLGQWEERLEQVIDEISAIDGVLCVDNLLDLVRTGGDSPANSLAAFLTPFVQQGELRIAGEATPEELDACRRMLPGFADCLQTLRIPEFDAATAARVLEQVVAALERDHKLQPSSDVPSTVYRLFQRYFRYRSFPGAAVDFLDDLFEQSADGQQPGVTTDQARELFAQRTGLPESFLRDDQPLNVADVFDVLRSHVLGQEAACRLTAELIATFKAGLNDPQRPLGVLLFCGPTGVGKTELAKAASRYLFGHGEEQDRLVRIDCSEFATHGSAELLLTRPDGEPGVLLSRVRQQPFVVVLLDEIEKASDDVFDLLLNLLEEGRLTDRFGRTTFFRSALVVMTSNLGARRGSSLGFAGSEGPDYHRAVLEFFRPEFVNRLDAIVPFAPLPHEIILDIARKELAELADREGLVAAGLKLAFSEKLVERVAAGGFDARFGARPLQRFVERVVVAPLSRYLVGHPELRNAVLYVDLPAGTETAIVGIAT